MKIKKEVIGIDVSKLTLDVFIHSLKHHFIVSNNLLPLGSLCYVLFCTSKYGWGFKNFLKEANCGEGISFPKQVGFYVSYIIPVIILVIFIQGYISKFL